MYDSFSTGSAHANSSRTPLVGRAVCPAAKGPMVSECSGDLFDVSEGTGFDTGVFRESDAEKLEGYDFGYGEGIGGVGGG